MLKDQAENLLTEALVASQHLFLIDFQIDQNNNIKVVIDGDRGVTVEDCVMISRAIEHNLDKEMYDFSLEVTSAGATSPLVLPRQYLKNAGRILTVKTLSGETLEGNLQEVNEKQITLKWTDREPKQVGKGKITVEKTTIIPFENIKESKVKLIFN